eukprot:2162380-Rhodomonas_salina.1
MQSQQHALGVDVSQLRVHWTDMHTQWTDMGYIRDRMHWTDMDHIVDRVHWTDVHLVCVGLERDLECLELTGKGPRVP